MINELPIPPDAKTAKQAVEVFRGWIIDGPLQCSLLPTLWKENHSTWGILLADVATHIANALHEEYGLDRQEVIHNIKKVFMAELANPSDSPEGGLPENRN